MQNMQIGRLRHSCQRMERVILVMLLVLRVCQGKDTVRTSENGSCSVQIEGCSYRIAVVPSGSCGRVSHVSRQDKEYPHEPSGGNRFSEDAFVRNLLGILVDSGKLSDMTPAEEDDIVSEMKRLRDENSLLDTKYWDDEGDSVEMDESDLDDTKNEQDVFPPERPTFTVEDYHPRNLHTARTNLKSNTAEFGHAEVDGPDEKEDGWQEKHQEASHRRVRRSAKTQDQTGNGDKGAAAMLGRWHRFSKKVQQDESPSGEKRRHQQERQVSKGQGTALDQRSLGRRRRESMAGGHAETALSSGKSEYERLTKKMKKLIEKLSVRVLRWWRKLDKKLDSLEIRRAANGMTSANLVYGQCPKGFQRLDNWPSCYLLTQFNATWYEAKEYCAAFDSDLVAMGTVKEHYLLTFLIKNSPSLASVTGWWTSGSFLGNTKQWMWTSSFYTKPFTFIKWGQGMPRDDGMQCMLLRADDDHKWHDAVCTERFNFICESSIKSY